MPDWDANVRFGPLESQIPGERECQAIFLHIPAAGDRRVDQGWQLAMIDVGPVRPDADRRGFAIGTKSRKLIGNAGMFLIQSPDIDLLLRSLLLTSAAMIWVVTLVRIVGLRSFSKMTSFDFVMTIATGSLLAGAAQSTSWSGFAQAMLAMAGLFFVQYAIARLRKISVMFKDVIQNEPILLMRNGKIIQSALQETRVAESDLIAKLREANAIDMTKIKAVVLETTGDISVLHGDDDVDDRLICQVRGYAPERTVSPK